MFADKVDQGEISLLCRITFFLLDDNQIKISMQKVIRI